jgi:hypothetical protein
MNRLADPAVLGELAERQEAFIADLTGALDLQAGLREATVGRWHAGLVADLATALDVEWGLVAAMITAGLRPGPAPDDRPVADVELRLRRGATPGRDDDWFEEWAGSAVSDAIGSDAPLTAAMVIESIAHADPAVRLLRRAAMLTCGRQLNELQKFVDVAGVLRGKVDALFTDLAAIADMVPLCDDPLRLVQTYERVMSLETLRERVRDLDAVLEHLTRVDLGGVEVALARTVWSLDRHVRLLRNRGAGLDELGSTVVVGRALASTTIERIDAVRDLAGLRAESRVVGLAASLGIAVRDEAVGGGVPGRAACGRLDRAASHFVGADLRGLDLARVPLDGIRWSGSTRWPARWAAAIVRDSVYLDDDLYEIRSGTADLARG